MGDTFSDDWQDDVPQLHRGWRYEGCDNTKWDGNYYSYRREGADSGYHEVIVRSLSMYEKELVPIARYHDDRVSAGVQLDLWPETGEAKRYSDFTTCLDAAIDMWELLDKQLRPVISTIRELGWERDRRF